MTWTAFGASVRHRRFRTRSGGSPIPARGPRPHRRRVDAGGARRPGAWVAEITRLLDLAGWPPGMRLIVRKERPHPGGNCGSPTMTGTASPHSLPIPEVGTCRSWNCATVAGPAAKTVSARRRTPADATSRSAASLPTASGWLWSPRHGSDRVDADPGLRRPSGSPMGSENIAAAAVFDTWSPCPSRPARPSVSIGSPPVDGSRTHRFRTPGRP